MQQQLQQTTGVTEAAPATANSTSTQAGLQAAPTNPATNFVDTTTDQVVSVRQDGTGKAIYAAAGRTSAIVGISGADAGVYGVSTATTGQTAGIKASSSSPRGYGLVAFETATAGTGFSYGIYGTAASTLGIGIRGTATAASGQTVGMWGTSSSTSGYGIKATADASSGNTVGLQASVNSPTGTAATIQNLASGPITAMLLQAGTKAGIQFSVDGSGNVTSAGTFRGSGFGLTGIRFSQISGLLGNAQLSGSYGNAVSLSNASNVFRGNGAGLTGLQFSQIGGLLGSTQFGGSYNNVVTLSNPANVFYGDGSHLSGTGGGGGGGGDYIRNGTMEQGNANFNISGNGRAGGTLTAATVNAGGYQIDGSNALSIPRGAQDLFVGLSAGNANTTGGYNTFAGDQAGYRNTTGSYNTFYGVSAGYENTTTNYNTFYGWWAGYNNRTGSSNTYAGYEAGVNTYDGSYNTFYGAYSGNHLSVGSNNIYIANFGANYESNTIRIGGDEGVLHGPQTATYIVGIYGSTSSSGIPVYINSDGKLGTLTSSLRFKEQIRDMGGSSSALMKLRPVTFLYKPEYDKGQRTLQYGLIAEEVSEVYPDLVAYEPDGKPYTVKYQYLASMLLNELQKQHAVVAAQQERIKSLQEELQQQREEFQERLSRLEKLISHVPTVAQK